MFEFANNRAAGAGLDSAVTIHRIKPLVEMEDDGSGGGSCMYEGEWNDNGLPHGLGIKIWKDGTRYEGAWQNGKQNGFGRTI